MVSVGAYRVSVGVNTMSIIGVHRVQAGVNLVSVCSNRVSVGIQAVCTYQYRVFRCP